MPTWGNCGLRLTVDLLALQENYALLSTRSGGECAAVVKADGYGLGLVEVARALSERCRTYFVALPEEGARLRMVLPEATIYVLNGAFEDARALVEARLVPFVSSMQALAEWPEGAPFALNVDTGMNRLGVSPREALSAKARAPVLVASHFACADEQEHPLNAVQEAAFAKVRAGFAGTPASLANSAALLTRKSSHYDLTRPGIALYGCAPTPSSARLKPVVRLEARVIQVRDVARGESVGYGAAQTARRPSRVAIASCGYADGFLRAAGGSDAKAGAPAFVNGAAVRLMGRVSMDLVAVDVTGARCERGDWIELFGENVPIEEAAAAAGTIGYELLTGLSRRAERRYGAP